MNSLLKSTYTYMGLKENILKLLGEYSVNGNVSSESFGFLADVEKRLVSTLNICLRRVMLNLPLLKKECDLQFFDGRAELPEDCHEVLKLQRKTDGAEVGFNAVYGAIECKELKRGESAHILYSAEPEQFSSDMPGDALIELPDITADALCYLTASELVPAEYGELYGKLMYRYRDICLNYYNCMGSSGGRNSFYSSGRRNMFRF